MSAPTTDPSGSGKAVSITRSRPAWDGSDRRDRLPPNWRTEIRPAVHNRNPEHICHMCGQPGGSELDHIQRGDHLCQQPQLHTPGCLCNLDWIHNRQDYLEGRSRQNCHGRKTGAEGAAARTRLNRPEPPHPALR